MTRSSQWTRTRSWRLPVRRTAGAGVVLGVVLGLAVTACGGGGGAGGGVSDPAPTRSGDGVSGEITVFAAASLTEAFTRIGKDFESANPEASVRFGFGGSSNLSQQVVQGAPADVFASADEAQMQVVTDADGVAGKPTVFVQNKLQIVVPRGNPANVTGLADFGDEDLAIAICAAEVPCGAAAEEAFDLAGVEAAPDTLEQEVKAVLTKVALGEADAGLVYVTDVTSAGEDVEGVDFPEADQAVNDYPIAVLEDAPHAAAAQAFVEHVLSARGRRVLAGYGFDTDVS